VIKGVRHCLVLILAPMLFDGETDDGDGEHLAFWDVEVFKRIENTIGKTGADRSGHSLPPLGVDDGFGAHDISVRE
jgi:hypothetical protein